MNVAKLIFFAIRGRCFCRIPGEILHCVQNDRSRSLSPRPPQEIFGGGRGKRRPYKILGWFLELPNRVCVTIM